MSNDNFINAFNNLYDNNDLSKVNNLINNTIFNNSLNDNSNENKFRFHKFSSKSKVNSIIRNNDYASIQANQGNVSGKLGTRGMDYLNTQNNHNQTYNMATINTEEDRLESQENLMKKNFKVKFALNNPIHTNNALDNSDNAMKSLKGKNNKINRFKLPFFSQSKETHIFEKANKSSISFNKDNSSNLNKESILSSRKDDESHNFIIKNDPNLLTISDNNESLSLSKTNKVNQNDNLPFNSKILIRSPPKQTNPHLKFEINNTDGLSVILEQNMSSASIINRKTNPVRLRASKIYDEKEINSIDKFISKLKYSNNHLSKSSNSHTIIEEEDKSNSNSAEEDFFKDNNDISKQKNTLFLIQLANKTRKNKVDEDLELEKRNLTIINKVYDSLSDNEDINAEEDYLMQKSFSIDPESNFNIIKNCFFLMAIFYSVTYLPYALAFKTFDYTTISSSQLNFNLLIDLVYIFNLILNFFTGYFSENKIIYNYKLIAINNLFGGFFQDLITAIPFTSMFLISKIKYFNYYLEKYNFDIVAHNEINDDYYCYTFLEWIRVLSLFRLSSTLRNLFHSKLESNPHFLSIFSYIKFVLFWIISCNILACIWVFIGKNNYKNYGEGWIVAFEMTNEENYKLYIISLYFNLVTILTVGYGDIYPTNKIEKFYVIIFLFFSNIIYSLLISWLSSMVSRSSLKEEYFNKKQRVFEQIMSDYYISFDLENKIKSSLALMKKNFIEDKEELMEMLPEILRATMYKSLYQHKIKSLSFFRNKSEEFVLYCAPNLILQKPENKDIIISHGEMFNELFILNKGTLDFYLGDHLSYYSLITMHKGYHFGEVNIFSNSPSDYTIKTKGYRTEMYCLRKNTLQDLKINFPEIMDSILKKSLEEYYNLEVLKKEAILYYEEYNTLENFKCFTLANHICIENEKMNKEVFFEQIQKQNEPFSSYQKDKIEILTKMVEGNNDEDLDFSNDIILSKISKSTSAFNSILHNKTNFNTKNTRNLNKTQSLSKIFTDNLNRRTDNLNKKAMSLIKSSDNLNKENSNMLDNIAGTDTNNIKKPDLDDNDINSQKLNAVIYDSNNIKKMFLFNKSYIKYRDECLSHLQVASDKTAIIKYQTSFNKCFFEDFRNKKFTKLKNLKDTKDDKKISIGVIKEYQEDSSNINNLFTIQHNSYNNQANNNLVRYNQNYISDREIPHLLNTQSNNNFCKSYLRNFFIDSYISYKSNNCLDSFSDSSFNNSYNESSCSDSLENKSNCNENSVASQDNSNVRMKNNLEILNSFHSNANLKNESINKINQYKNPKINTMFDNYHKKGIVSRNFSNPEILQLNKINKLFNSIKKLSSKKINQSNFSQSFNDFKTITEVSQYHEGRDSDNDDSNSYNSVFCFETNKNINFNNHNRKNRFNTKIKGINKLKDDDELSLKDINNNCQEKTIFLRKSSDQKIRLRDSRKNNPKIKGCKFKSLNDASLLFIENNQIFTFKRSNSLSFYFSRHLEFLNKFDLDLFTNTLIYKESIGNNKENIIINEEINLDDYNLKPNTVAFKKLKAIIKKPKQNDIAKNNRKVKFNSLVHTYNINSENTDIPINNNLFNTNSSESKLPIDKISNIMKENSSLNENTNQSIMFSRLNSTLLNNNNKIKTKTDNLIVKKKPKLNDKKIKKISKRHNSVTISDSERRRSTIISVKPKTPAEDLLVTTNLKKSNNNNINIKKETISLKKKLIHTQVKKEDVIKKIENKIENHNLLGNNINSISDHFKNFLKAQTNNNGIEELKGDQIKALERLAKSKSPKKGLFLLNKNK